MHNFTPRLFIVVGNPASGKDELISAVDTIGTLHAEIVPKHTTRSIKPDDGDEMICQFIYDTDGIQMENPDYKMNECDVQYDNYGTKYGIKTSFIWDKLREGIIQVAVVGDSGALNQLKGKFGNLAVVLYVYSQVDRNTYRERELEKQKNKPETDSAASEEYINKRVEDFDKAWKIYTDNFMLFDHVLIYADKQEDLFDQIFRLFKAYENRWVS